MGKTDFRTISLGEGAFVVLEPETLLWVIAEATHLKQAYKLLSDTYSELQDDLKQDTERMRTSHLVDMIELHPTTACNMRCAYCYIPEAHRKRPLVMSRDDVDRIVRKLFS